jgi:hypothetical protein
MPHTLKAHKRGWLCLQPEGSQDCVAPHLNLQATVQLAQDQYGNYVIQHVVEQGRPHERNQVFERLFPHIVVLSQNKFASNVVEKMLLHCEIEQRAAIVEEFLRQPPGAVAAPNLSDDANARDQTPLEQMMQDQYGNYVVQKTLEVGRAVSVHERAMLASTTSCCCSHA